MTVVKCAVGSLRIRLSYVWLGERNNKSNPPEKVIRKNALAGFTIFEILIALLIISVVAAIAIPSYIRTIESAKAKEAISTLRAIYAAQQAYRLRNGNFYPNWITHPDKAYASEIRSALGLRIEETYFKFSLDTSSADDFTGLAERKDGPYKEAYIKIDQNGTLDGKTGGWPISIPSR